jgi:hypothetical protein
MAAEGALILYGNGAELENFKFFADDLATNLAKKYKRENIKSMYVYRGADFLNQIASHDVSKWQIKELHVFPHFIGGGLMLGYYDRTIESLRRALLTTSDGTLRKPNYTEVVHTEIGAILTDHLLLGTYPSTKSAVSAAFSP